ncbi:MAG: hypothetical protein H0W72_02255 [Planctomycetes bacterium]|nr:hypothetical protein [Planctomycetota bacterium]
MRCVFATLLLFSQAMAADVAIPPLPANAAKAVEAADAAASKAMQSFLQALQREEEKLAATLQREMEAETRKGDLDGALAVKARLDQVRSGAWRTIWTEPQATDLLGKPIGKLVMQVIPADELPDKLAKAITVKGSTTGSTADDPSAANDDDLETWANFKRGKGEVVLTYSQPIRTSAILLYQRNKGGGEDTFTAGYVQFNDDPARIAFGDFPASSVLVVPVPAGISPIDKIRVVATAGINKPGLKEIRLLP